MFVAIRGLLTTFGFLALTLAAIAAVTLVAFIGIVVGFGLGLSLIALVLPLVMILTAVFLVTRFVHTE